MNSGRGHGTQNTLVVPSPVERGGQEWTWSIGDLAAALAQINKTGLTQFRLRFHKDDNDDNGNDYLNWHAGEAAAGSRPELIVIYDVP